MTLPRATYRLQFNPRFGFRDALAAVPYLHDLGISHLYASPLLRPVTGSTHGYDTTDPTTLNPDLGARDDFDELVAALRTRGMGLLLDIVPNHMAAHHENPWWWDLLRLGPASRYAAWFDIDWPRAAGRVVLPILAESPDDAVASGQLRLMPHASSLDAFFSLNNTILRYHDHLFPLSPGTPRTTDVSRVLAAQHYELAHWREGLARINYRRFFDVTGLVGFRADDPEPFAASHALILDLVEHGFVDGLRIDHIDGLADPDRYLAMLRAALASRGRPDLYVIVEKILAPGERLRESWPVHGTTGYDYLKAASRLFVNPGGFAAFERRAQARLALRPWPDTALNAKSEVLRTLFPSEVASLVDDLHHRAPSIARAELEAELADRTAALPVYRTYEPGATARESSSAAVEAVDSALTDPAFSRRWQQLTGPVAAKGVEDTALYRHIVLSSLNEVGGEPFLHADPVAAFHAHNAAAALTPATMLATSTHDTKRSEDVRSRIHALSELAEEWTAANARWSSINAALRGPVSPRDEELLYQTLVGVCPLTGTPGADITRRVQDYAVKAAREAKLETSWLAPSEPYESALRAFVAALQDPARSAAFLAELRPLADRAARIGALNSLAQIVLKCFAPGVPDTYQGCELWDDSLVDPDNRRPVDFAARAAALASLRDLPADFCSNWRDGYIKLWTLARCLAARREHADLLARGTYVPLRAAGPRADHVIAFARARGDQCLVVVAPRLTSALLAPQTLRLAPDAFDSTELTLPGAPRAQRSSLFTGDSHVAARIPVASLLAAFPVAVLFSDDSPAPPASASHPDPAAAGRR